MSLNTRMKKIITLTLLLTSLILSTLDAQLEQLDVLSYDLILRLNLQEKSIKGEVNIKLRTETEDNTIHLDAGQLTIDEVTGAHVQSFKKEQSKLIIQLTKAQQSEQKITIYYHGSPNRGLLFDTDLEQAHTIYFTSQWMVCNDVPHDKATLKLNIIAPKGKQCIASGELVGTEEFPNGTLFQWEQNYATPPYTYGFVIGTFQEVTDYKDSIKLSYFSAQQSKAELKKIFEATAEILTFFEEKAGIPYMQDSYSQILIGNNYQEMSGLSVLSTSYAGSVLKDSSEIHLTAHELAHQWWGNRITCKSFNHFWLNEAFAVYMASAFNEYKFGKEKYLSDISLYKRIYDDVVKRGKDKALVFQGWKALRDNRSIVYYKGAYVLHLLRQKIGDEVFWKGIRHYSQRYYGQSVETKDFQDAMEQATDIDLNEFFRQWVY